MPSIPSAKFPQQLFLFVVAMMFAFGACGKKTESGRRFPALKG